jgi:peptidoglycan/xylan/chitin deacetylase (PgdA/CDA1 family)
MKTITTLALFTSLFIGSLHAQTILEWYNGKTAATSITYDDWLTGHGPIVIPALVERNMAASLYVNTDWAYRGGGYAQMMYAVENGIEIGNHTVEHLSLTEVSSAEAIAQIQDAFTEIEDSVTNQECETFAYPFGNYDDEVIDIVQQQHIGARAVWGRWYWNNNWIYNFASNEDSYFDVTTYAFNSSKSFVSMASEMDNAEINGGLITFMLHEVYNNEAGDPQGFDAIDETLHGEFLDFVKSYDNVFWIATFRDIIKYHKERKHASISQVTEDGAAVTYSLTDDLDNAIYNHPLTAEVYYESSKNLESVYQDDKPIEYERTGNFVTFNAIPDNGPIYLYKTGILTDGNDTHKPLVNAIYPNPFQEHLTISVPTGNFENWNVAVFTPQGKMVYSETVTNAESATLNLDRLEKGVYTIKISSDSGVHSETIQKL